MAAGTFSLRMGPFQHVIVLVSEASGRAPRLLIVAALTVIGQTSGMDIFVTINAFLN